MRMDAFWNIRCKITRWQVQGKERARVFVSWEIMSYETKNAPRGCALARSRNMLQATALGARMCQGTFFFTGGRSDGFRECE